MTVLENLKARYLDTGLHTVWVDEAEGVATFPLWNLSGQMVGFQQYRPAANKRKDNHPRDSRYFTYRKNRVVGVWGLESWNLSNTLFVTEGVFDAASLPCRGYSAVATLSKDLDDSHKQWLWTVRKARCVVVVCDNDAAGRKLAKYGDLYHVVDSGDLGDASDNYVSTLVQKYS